MNKITISWIFLIVISMLLPTSAIMSARGQTDDNNSNGSSTDGGTTMDNSGSSTGGGGTTDNSGSNTTGDGTTMDNSSLSTGGGGTTDNSGSNTTGDGTTTVNNSSSNGGGNTNTTTDNSSSSTTGGSTNNSTTLPTTSAASNNTENTVDLANSILAVHNRERADVGVPPLVWNDTLAADAKTWAEHLATTGEFRHCDTATEVCNYHGEGENLAGFNPSKGISAPGEGQQLWVAEKKDYHGGELTKDNWYPSGHYTQMVWKNTKEVGCATATGNNFSWWPGHPVSVLVCRYNPPGNYMGQAPY